MNDYEIIQKLKRREEDGLRDLMKQYSGYVAAIVCNISQGILSVEDVEELSADVFLSVWNHAAGLMEDRPLRPYLAQAARNTAISRLRKRGEAALPFDDDIITLQAAENPDELAIKREQTQIINSAVEAFGEPDREIFIRFYFLGERIEAIGRRLAMNQSTIRTKLHRCRKRIKGIFEERGYQYE